MTLNARARAWYDAAYRRWHAGGRSDEVGDRCAAIGARYARMASL